jgi:hypothetical protein
VRGLCEMLALPHRHEDLELIECHR